MQTARAIIHVTGIRYSYGETRYPFPPRSILRKQVFALSLQNVHARTRRPKVAFAARIYFRKLCPIAATPPGAGSPGHEHGRKQLCKKHSDLFRAA